MKIGEWAIVRCRLDADMPIIGWDLVSSCDPT